MILKADIRVKAIFKEDLLELFNEKSVKSIYVRWFADKYSSQQSFYSVIMSTGVDLEYFPKHLREDAMASLMVVLANSKLTTDKIDLMSKFKCDNMVAIAHDIEVPIEDIKGLLKDGWGYYRMRKYIGNEVLIDMVKRYYKQYGYCNVEMYVDPRFLRK